MPLYKYSGVAWQGGKVTGTVEAYNEGEAMLRVRETCQVVLSLRRTRSRNAAPDSVEADEGRKGFLDIEFGPRRLNLKVFSVMCNQFAVILRSGMPVARTVQMVSDTIADKLLYRWLRQVLRDVESGARLADSMEARGKDFLPHTFVETVRAGESSGNLERSFQSMSKHFEAQYKMRAQIRSAMVYPVFLLIVAVIVMAVIMIYVVPMFSSIFESAGSEIPALTRIVIDLSNFVKEWWWLLPVFALAAYSLFRFLDSFPKIHRLFGRVMLQLPIVGNISQLSAACQFAETMSTLISSGLTIVNATAITADVISNPYLSARTGELVGMLETGTSLSDGMRSQGVMAPMLVEMVALGEGSGELEQTLTFMSEYYGAELETATSAAVKKLGPGMLIIIGGFCLFIMAGVYAGMFGMYNSMGAAMGLGE